MTATELQTTDGGGDGRKKWGLDPWGLLSAGLFLVALSTAAGFFSKFWWGFEVASSMRLPYVECSALAAVAYAVGRKKRQFALALLLVVVNAAMIVPRYFGGGVRPETPTCRVLLSNVKTDNRRYDLLLELVRKESPDLVILEEVNQDWVDALDDLRTAYPHFVEYPETDNFGIALYSRLPLTNLSVKMIGDIQVASIHASFVIQGELWHVVATHPVPPTGGDYWRWRNNQLAELADYLRGLDGHVALVGDLNMTQWSHYFDKLERESGLRDGSQGFGLCISWPAFFPPMGVPIDHCLLSSNLGTCDRRTGPSVGSDHYPVIFDLAPLRQETGQVAGVASDLPPKNKAPR